jgi:hypothetical protein
VVTDAPPTRAELRALYAEDNRRRTQHEIDRRQWQQAQEALEKAQERAEEPEALMYRTADNDAPEPAPAAEPEPFYEQSSTAPNFFDDIERNEEFADTLATVIAELHREFDARIERAQQRILNTVVRLVMPSEYAERELYLLRDRITRAEERIEKQLKAAVADDDNVLDLPANFWKRDVA